MRAAKTSTQVRREQIAEAALALLADRRGAVPSIAGIARRVGVVPSAVYRHYRGKDAILAAALALVEQRLAANVQAARGGRSDGLGRLRELFFRYADLLAANPGGPQVLLTHGVFGASRSRRQRVGQVIAGYLGEVARLVAEGQASGAIRVDLEPQTAALVFMGMLLPAVIFRQVLAGDFDVAGHACKAWPALEAALRAPPAADSSPSVGAGRPAGRRRREPNAKGG